MNLLLLTPDDFFDDDHVRLNCRRFRHIQEVHQAKEGDTLRVGLINEQMGTGLITKVNDVLIELKVQLADAPPAKLPLTVLLALPRPKMLKRSLQHLTTLGVERIVLMNSYRVEKSFWQSPWLNEEKIHEQLLLGLEQARDTVLPEIMLEKRFKPFVEDRLPAMVAGKRAMVAHPGSGDVCPRSLAEASVLAIGPEGGFIPYEVEKLQAAGFQVINMGSRILRVETAVTALVSKLYD